MGRSFNRRNTRFFGVINATLWDVRAGSMCVLAHGQQSPELTMQIIQSKVVADPSSKSSSDVVALLRARKWWYVQVSRTDYAGGSVCRGQPRHEADARLVYGWLNTQEDLDRFFTLNPQPAA